MEFPFCPKHHELINDIALFFGNVSLTCFVQLSSFFLPFSSHFLLYGSFWSNITYYFANKKCATLNEARRENESSKQTNKTTIAINIFMKSVYTYLCVCVWMACMAVSLSIFHEHSVFGIVFLLFRFFCLLRFKHTSFVLFGFICDESSFPIHLQCFFFLVHALSNLTCQSLSIFGDLRTIRVWVKYYDGVEKQCFCMRWIMVRER